MASFDIVCEVDIQEVTNAVDQARREINNRYDFKGTNCEIELDKIKPALMITADDELKMQTTIDILLTKLIKRSVPVLSLIPISDPTRRYATSYAVFSLKKKMIYSKL